MKRSFGLTLLFSIFTLISVSLVEAISAPSWVPSLPKMPSFNLSALKTPEAVSNAISRIASAFGLLSPKTLASIIKTQTQKLNKNMNAYIENPSWANGRAVTANALAATAAALALAGEAAGAYLIGKKAVERIEKSMPYFPG